MKPGNITTNNTDTSKADEKYMSAALAQAVKAYKIKEVPIGCVIVHDNKIIARGYNRRNTDKTTLGHAEITAIRRASKVLGDWRLEECTMYVTLEPKAGCAGSILNILEMPQFNHMCSVTRGVLENECSRLLTDFFKELRNSKKRAETETL